MEKQHTGTGNQETGTHGSLLSKPDVVENGIKRQYSVTVLTEPEIVYAFWRDFTNFPLFMKNISKVEALSPTLSHWVIDMKVAPNVEWDAEIITEKPGEMIAWRSIGDGPVKQAGSVWFKKAPANLGTVVSLTISYEIPGGKLAELAGKLFGDDPQTMILTDLRRFKAYLETGEIPTTEGQPTGRNSETIKNETH